MKTLLLQIFTWWSGQTIGVRFTPGATASASAKMRGNVYYQGGGFRRPHTALGDLQRPVRAIGMIPPGWHGWMHHRTDVSPAAETYTAKPGKSRIRKPT
jgi:NADH:ubiquinone oxidoreductase subunit